MSNAGDRVRSPAYAAAPVRPGLAGWRLADHAGREAGPGFRARNRNPGANRVWGGAGGRWLLWPLRAVLWAALVIVAYRGITAIIFDSGNTSTGSGAAAPAAAADQFPVTLAEAYALQFGQVYLNFSPASQAQREQALAGFVAASVAAASPDLGWNGSGQARMQSEQVAGINVQDQHHAVISLLATVNGQPMELGVPVFAWGGAVAVSGAPAWLPAPQPISPSPPAAVSSDPIAQNQLLNQLPAFFQAYANGNGAALNRFLVPGTTVTGLGGNVEFDSIASLEVPRGGAIRQITVTVVWQVLSQGAPTGAKLKMPYRVSVVDLQSGKWYVKEVSASTEAVGAR